MATKTTTPTAPAAAAPEKKEKVIRYVAVTMFPALLERLQAETAPTDKHGALPMGTYVRDLLCEKFGIEKPTTTRRARTTYKSEAEKKAVKAAIKATRAEMLKKLMAAHQAEIDAAIAAAEAKARAETVETPAA